MVFDQVCKTAVFTISVQTESFFLTELRFYSPVNPLGSCQAGQFT